MKQFIANTFTHCLGLAIVASAVMTIITLPALTAGPTAYAIVSMP
ncbi:MAG: hypothetical protein ACRECW_09840 [Phyllobacterium sp.]